MTAPAPSSATTPSRLPALDALRGLALLLGVVLHACMSFLPSPAPIWMVADRQPTLWAAATFFFIHSFRMLVFFLLAGFFARFLLHRRGTRGFLLDRAKRITLPLIVFWPPTLAAIIALTVWNIRLQTGGSVPPELLETPPLSLHNFPLTHLWFLYLLTLIYVVFLPLRALVGQIPGAERGIRAATRLTGLPSAPLVFMLPTMAALTAQQNWLAWFGIPTPDQSLIPNLPAVVAYGSAFVVGWLLHRQPENLEWVARAWPFSLALALGSMTISLNILGLRPALQATSGDGQTILAYTVALSGWAWTYALLGLSWRFLQAPRRWLRSLAEASYWIYLLHLPLVVLLQVLMARQPWPAPLKLVVIVGGSLAVLLISDHLLVRSTWLGGWLNGKRRSRNGS